MSSNESNPNAPSVVEHMLQLTIGYMPAICINIVAKLGIADQLANGARSAAVLAKATNTNEDALYRVLRALSTVGVFSDIGSRQFAQTPASDMLRSDHPQSLRAIAAFLTDPLHFRCYSNLMHSVKTGETTAGPTLGKPLFEYLAENPEESEVFNDAMVNGTQVVIPPLLEAYDFSGIGTLVDVGGGHGSVLASILQKHKQMKGILYDLGHVVDGAPVLLERSGVADRTQVVAGSFFESVPSGGDAYIMKNIIHDWDDERCLVILKNILRASSSPNVKVLILETVLPADATPHPGKWFDIEMMALPGGRERTDEEFSRLLEKSGWRLTKIVLTKSLLNVIEAMPA